MNTDCSHENDVPPPYIASPETDAGAGTWQTVYTASSYGKVRKETNGDEVTIMVEPIGKKIHFSVEGHSEDGAISKGFVQGAT